MLRLFHPLSWPAYPLPSPGGWTRQLYPCSVLRSLSWMLRHEVLTAVPMFCVTDILYPVFCVTVAVVGAATRGAGDRAPAAGPHSGHLHRLQQALTALTAGPYSGHLHRLQSALTAAAAVTARGRASAVSLSHRSRVTAVVTGSCDRSLPVLAVLSSVST